MNKTIEEIVKEFEELSGGSRQETEWLRSTLTILRDKTIEECVEAIDEVEVFTMTTIRKKGRLDRLPVEVGREVKKYIGKEQALQSLTALKSKQEK